MLLLLSVYYHSYVLLKCLVWIVHLVYTYFSLFIQNFFFHLFFDVRSFFVCWMFITSSALYTSRRYFVAFNFSKTFFSRSRFFSYPKISEALNAEIRGDKDKCVTTHYFGTYFSVRKGIISPYTALVSYAPLVRLKNLPKLPQ